MQGELNTRIISISYLNKFMFVDFLSMDSDYSENEEYFREDTIDLGYENEAERISEEMYNRLIPTDPSSKWNFSLYTPDVVVINLLQNDSWIVQMTDSEEYKRRFSENTPDDEFIINAYEEFVSSIRDEYPESNIICSLGSMDAVKDGSKWKSYIETAVDNLNDEKIQIHFMPFLEAPAHPSIADQETMANSLIGFIEENVVW